MSAHKKLHDLISTADHNPGTINTVIGTDGAGALAEVPYTTLATANTLVKRTSLGDVIVATTPTDPNAATSKTYMETYVANFISGLSLKGSVSSLNVISDALSTPPGSPVAGDAYIVAATPSGWGISVNQGDLVAYTGSAWVRLVAGSGGAPLSGLRVVITGLNGTAAGSFAGHSRKLATYTTSWAFEIPANGWFVIVSGDGDYRENSGWVYDGATSIWQPFAAATPQHNNTLGIQGGASNDYYHLTQAQHDLAIGYKGKVTLVADPPLTGDASLSVLAADKDWVFAVAPSGSPPNAYVVVRLGSTKYAVEVSAI